MHVIWQSIHSIKPYANNPRINQHTVQQVASSISRFGWQQPIVVDKEAVILVGHTRYLAAKQLKLSTVPIVKADALTVAEAKAYRLADNKIGERSLWRKHQLAQELASLGETTQRWTGFSESERFSLLALCANTQQPLPRETLSTGASSEATVVRLGDHWQLGDHQILCGDSRQPQSLRRLLGEQQADLIFTDPPYGMGYGDNRTRHSTPKGARVKAHGPICGDERDPQQLSRLVKQVLQGALVVTRDLAPLYLCSHWRSLPIFLSVLEDLQQPVNSCIVWDKEVLGIGQHHYRSQFELILYVAGEPWQGERKQSNVWRCRRLPPRQYRHPTQKPSSLIKRAIINSSEPGAIVLDPFAGSGATLLACEAVNRQARLIEIEPHYLDALIQHWQHITQSSARLLPEGLTYTDVQQKRTAPSQRLQ